MSNIDKEMYGAFLDSRHLCETLLTAHTIKMEAGRDSKFYLENALDQLKKVADYFGCDLVPRSDKKEAA